MAQSATSQCQPRAWTVPSGVGFGDLQRLVLQPFEDTKADTTTIPVATRAVGLNLPTS
jgi:hypothetical protein